VWTRGRQVIDASGRGLGSAGEGGVLVPTGSSVRARE
jgi:hypothetical protein